MPRLSRRAFAATALSVPMLPGALRAQEATPAGTPARTPPDLVSAALEALPAVVEEMMERTGVPGVAVAVVADDQVVFAEGFGVRNVDTGEAVDADTVFQLASVSKPLGSTVIASLVGDGEIGWDTRMAEIDSSFALSDPYVTANVTIADLYSHRSGLPDHAGDVLEDLGGTREEILHSLRYIEPDYPFRAGYAYTNFGLTAAAVSAAEFVGTTFEDLADTALFGPLDMTSSSYRHSDFVARENRADLHVQRNDGWVQAYERQPDAQTPAGGASSSARDMAQWMRLQLGHGTVDGMRLIDAGALGMTHVPHAISNPADPPFDRTPGFYGLGWNVNYDGNGAVNLGHSGAFALGAATAVYLRPADGLGIVVLTNGFPLGVPEAIALTFLDLATLGSPRADFLEVIGPIIAASAVPLYGQGVTEPPADPAPPLGDEAYAGTYTNDVFGDLVITSSDGGSLSMRLGPRQMDFTLNHFDRDVFTYTPVGENAGVDSAVSFSLGPDGSATRVVVENLDLYGAGTFTRA